MTRVTAGYDDVADVLYIALGRSAVTYVDDEEKDGLYYIRDENTDQAAAVTVDGYRELWTRRERDLARKVALFLQLDAQEVADAIRSVTAQTAESA